MRSLISLVMLSSTLLCIGCPADPEPAKDAGVQDAATSDSAQADGSSGDRWRLDSGSPDVAPPDVALPDTWTADMALTDVELTDLTFDGHTPDAADAGADDEAFRVIMLPDTQYYCEQTHGGLPEMFPAQTQWIVDNKESLNIVFVIHVGDVVYGWQNAVEWQRGVAAMSILDGQVPYAIAVGNHDGLNTAARETDNFNQHFPLASYENLPSFGDHFEPGLMDNVYHYFQAGGRDWLVLALEFGPRDEVLTWANQVVAAHPDHHVIMGTHGYLFHDDTLLGSSSAHGGNPLTYGRDNNGVGIWNGLVKLQPNFRVVLSGHINGVGRRVAEADPGNDVFEMLADYSSHDGTFGGGNGYLRILTFYPDQDKLTVQSYSPYLDEYLTDSENQFEWDDLDIFDD